jgi:hypothetical protein
MADSQPPYAVHWEIATPGIRAIWNRLRNQPFAERKRFHSALSELQQELSRAPLEWGEAKFELKAIRVVVCVGFSHRYRVGYGVDEIRRDVYVRSFRDSDE